MAASAAYRCPHPPFVLLFLHTTPAFIPFEHVVWCCRQHFWRGALSQRAPCCHAMAKIGATPRRLQCCRQARGTLWCSLSAYAGFGVRTQEVPQSLPWSSSFPHRWGPFLTIGVLSQTRQACVMIQKIMTPMIAHHFLSNHSHTNNGAAWSSW